MCFGRYSRLINMIGRVLAVVALALTGSLAAADIYRIVDEDGRVTFTNIHPRKLPRGSTRTLVLKSKSSAHRRARNAFNLASMRRNRELFEPIIRSAAQRHKVDPKLVHAVIRAESAYNPKAVSHKGAVGLMQLMPQTADRYGVTDSADPQQNINGGVNYLSDLLALFPWDIRLVVAAYNAGEQNVIKYGNRIPPFKETQHYVAKVMEFYGSDFELSTAEQLP